MAEEYPDQDIDWCHEGVITPPRDQKESRACWAIGAAGAVESNWNIQEKENRRLNGIAWNGDKDNILGSPQELYDGVPVKISKNQHLDDKEYWEGCSTINQGFRYIKKFGMRLDESYGFTGNKKPGKLKDPDNSPKIFIKNFRNIDPTNKKNVLDALRQGPICGTMLLHEGFSRFNGPGIFYGPVTNIRGKHCILIVGQGVQDDIPYYKIKNSYGPDWGEGGFGKIQKDLVVNISYPINAVMM